ncbi:nitrite reductase, copper-containing [bacterium]|nr:nitrite reductase, copper-containing [bacterium]
MRFASLGALVPRSRTSLATAFAVLALGAVLPLTAACSTETTNGQSSVTADLVAPPAVPPPIDRSSPAHVSYNLWTFNGSDPGPLIRVRVGDTVEIRLANPATNTQPHNIDLHAVNGPGGGMQASMVDPGQERAFTFKAKSAGLFTYHCAAGIVADHIANGMYGGILVEPANGMPTSADHEYYIGQNEFYTTGATGAKGPQDLDYNKLQHEDPTYVAFNGSTTAITGNKALQAKTGDTVRLFMVDGGPNYASSFHVIGEIFDRAWDFGSLINDPLRGIQTITVPPGGSVITEFKVDVPGDYKIVDHAISRVGLGAAGVLHVTGDPDTSIFNALGPATSINGGSGSATSTMTMTPSTPSATTTPTPAPSAAATTPASTEAQTITLQLKDNFFDPAKLTVKAGQHITFDLKNVGKVPHNLAIADKGGNYGDVASDLVRGGEDLKFDWTAPAATGVYNFRCDVHPTQMTGTITVQ